MLGIVLGTGDTTIAMAIMGTIMGTGGIIPTTAGTVGNDKKQCSAWLCREEMGRNPGVKVRVRVGTSRIAGQGLFAAQDMRQGASIIQYIGEKISKAESHTRLAQGNAYIFELNERYEIDGKMLRNTARYINHSCDPNCLVEKTTRAIWIIALRNIKAGEELSYNYGYDAKKYVCTCGAKNCCGYILDEDYW
jgi:SET domain-containing protein